MIWITANWKLLVAGVFTLAIILSVHWVDKKIYDQILNEKIAAQKTADSKTCTDNQKITKDANDQIISNLKVITDKYFALVLQHPTTTVSIASQPIVATSKPSIDTRPHGGSPKAGIIAGSDKPPITGHTDVTGTNTDFRAIGAECEIYRTTLLTCMGVDAAIHKGLINGD